MPGGQCQAGNARRAMPGGGGLPELVLLGLQLLLELGHLLGQLGLRLAARSRLGTLLALRLPHRALRPTHP
eukprot:5014943-Pyramimonas_sp.AAC.2